MSTTYSQIRQQLNNRLHQKMAILGDDRSAVNFAVRAFVSDHDWKGLKRRSALAPNLYGGIFDYAAPADLKDDCVIDVAVQGYGRSTEAQWNKVSEQEFDRRKNADRWMISMSDSDVRRTLRVSAPVGTVNDVTVSPLDSLTSGSSNGTAWAAGGDATAVAADSGDYVQGNGSLSLTVGTGGTGVASISNSALTAVDLTDLVAYGSAFLWLKLASAADAAKVTGVRLRIGTDASNYRQVTATATNEATSFAAGWNLVRFDLSGATTVGAPGLTAQDYADVSVLSASSALASTTVKMDWLAIKVGQFNDLLYYSSYPWRSASGTWKEDSTLDTDLLNLESSEVPMLLDKLVAEIGPMVEEYKDSDRSQEAYYAKLKQWKRENPSEAIVTTDTWARQLDES